MKIIRKTNELENILKSVKDSTKSIGLVLTMGNIHDGHMSLLTEAKNNNEFVIVTIFINPTQFNSKQDYNSYPKTQKEDIEKLKSAKCDLLYLPTVNDIYPKGLVKEKSVDKYRNILCDIFRPGHFDGVTTVVDTFFNIIQPNNSYFGEKDYQQVKLIKEMVKLKNYNIDIIPCTSIRDINGMSLSSRNSNFNSYQLKVFQNLAKKINLLINNIKQNKNINIEDFKKDLSKNNINKIEYLEIRDENNLEITKNFSAARLFLALYIDHIRIIDNFKLY